MLKALNEDQLVGTFQTFSGGRNFVSYFISPSLKLLIQLALAREDI